MASKPRLVIKDCLWVCGGTQTSVQRHAINDVATLRSRGAKIFILKDYTNRNELEQLRRRLWQQDDHVILGWHEPKSFAAILPLLRERKNFSVVGDDWWFVPNWLIRESTYILFRKYNGIATYLNNAPFVCAEPPLFFSPYPHFAAYSALCAVLRPFSLAASPLVDLWNWVRRRGETITREKCLYLPWSINGNDVPLKTEKLEYDFGNTAGTFGVWFIRNPHVPFRYSFANLYEDRRRLTDFIATFQDQPFKFYDCRREKSFWLPYEEYLRKTRQSRYVIATGGLADTALHKFLEYTCSGTPMIGRSLPFEFPWLKECVFEVDIMRLQKPADLKPLLHEAMDRYPVFKEKTLNWRDRLLELYNFNRILDMLQDQVDGKPVPSDYLTPEAPVGPAKQN